MVKLKRDFGTDLMVSGAASNRKKCERFCNVPKYHIYKKSYVFNFWRSNEICKNLFNPRLPDSLDGLHGVVEKAGIDGDAGHHALSVRENRPETQADFSQAWRFYFLAKTDTCSQQKSGTRNEQEREDAILKKWDCSD